jgi:hypothetical protein
MEIVDSNNFRHETKCPYCNKKMTCSIDGMIEDDEGRWMADSIQMDCETEPDIDSAEWEEWFATHSDMPYAYMLPAEQKALRYINSKYRFTE